VCDFDSERVRTEAMTNLRELAKSLGEYADSDLLIVGHTDQLGSRAYNQRLSEHRASRGATYLTSEGVDAARLDARGVGEAEPVATNDTEAGRQANRRVEIAIFAGAKARAAAKKASAGG
jgi:outer membrane protein OmpA-like peptidoglycan-associated protein